MFSFLGRFLPAISDSWSFLFKPLRSFPSQFRSAHGAKILCAMGIPFLGTLWYLPFSP